MIDMRQDDKSKNTVCQMINAIEGKIKQIKK